MKLTELFLIREASGASVDLKLDPEELDLVHEALAAQLNRGEATNPKMKALYDKVEKAKEKNAGWSTGQGSMAGF